MSFGVSLSDFVGAGTLAYQVWSACRDAPKDYQELGELCREIGIVVESCRPQDPYSVLRAQSPETLGLLARNCKATLERLEAILSKYNNLGTIHNLGKKMGFIVAKKERENIRSRLREHLAAINTFLSGVQVETLGLTVQLLLQLLEEQKDSSHSAMEASIIDDPQKMHKLLKDFGSENSIADDELVKNKDLIRVKMKATLEQGKETSTRQPTPMSQKQHSDMSGVKDATTPQILPAGPTPVDGHQYDPYSIEWFRDGGFKFLTPVPCNFQYNFKIEPPVLRYSEEDEWLSSLPEGWSFTQCLINRQLGRKEEAFYYSFNNLSCSSGNMPRTSRAYFYNNSFLSVDRQRWNITSGHLEPVVKFRLHQPSAYSLTTLIEYSGFFDRSGRPFDLGDDLSRELAQIETGTSGTRSNYSNELIDQSLPEDWTWTPELYSRERIIYIDLSTETESTVHPARFYNPEDEKSIKLPPGWDRRLDSWGNLFFVDHHTQQAVREDPRYNTSIDQDTGLPKGWQEIRDHEKKQFFFTPKGKLFIGTYKPTTMKSKSLDNKRLMHRAPRDGENPSTLIKRFGLERSVEEKASTILAANNAPQMTGEEKERYYELFQGAEKAKSSTITMSEALKHCQSFDLPPGELWNILTHTDANHDMQWNVDEYAEALHQVRFQMEKRFKSDGIPARTPEETQKYYAMFENSKSTEKPIMSRREVWAACKDFDLPSDLVKRIFLDADLNKDQKWNVDEFAHAMHEIMFEVKKREALRKLSPRPVEDPKQGKPSDLVQGAEKSDQADSSSATIESTEQPELSSMKTVEEALTRLQSETESQEPPGSQDTKNFHALAVAQMEDQT